MVFCTADTSRSGLMPSGSQRQHGEAVRAQLQFLPPGMVLSRHRCPVHVPVVVVAQLVRSKGRELVRVEDRQLLARDQQDGPVVEPDEGIVEVDDFDRDRPGAGAIIQNPFSCRQFFSPREGRSSPSSEGWRSLLLATPRRAGRVEDA